MSFCIGFHKVGLYFLFPALALSYMAHVMGQIFHYYFSFIHPMILKGTFEYNILSAWITTVNHLSYKPVTYFETNINIDPHPTTKNTIAPFNLYLAMAATISLFHEHCLFGFPLQKAYVYTLYYTHTKIYDTCHSHSHLWVWLHPFSRTVCRGSNMGFLAWISSLFLAGDFAVKKETNEMPISGFLPFGGLHQLKILKRSTGLRVPLPIGPGGGWRTYPPGKVNELDMFGGGNINKSFFFPFFGL